MLTSPMLIPDKQQKLSPRNSVASETQPEAQQRTKILQKLKSSSNPFLKAQVSNLTPLEYH